MAMSAQIQAQDTAVYGYLTESRMRGVNPEAASAVLLLNLVREVHKLLAETAGPTYANEAVYTAIDNSLSAMPVHLTIL